MIQSGPLSHDECLFVGTENILFLDVRISGIDQTNRLEIVSQEKNDCSIRLFIESMTSYI
jgi:hypothetical protein